MFFFRSVTWSAVAWITWRFFFFFKSVTWPAVAWITWMSALISLRPAGYTIANIMMIVMAIGILEKSIMKSILKCTTEKSGLMTLIKIDFIIDFSKIPSI